MAVLTLKVESMLRKTAVLGFVLILISIALFAWTRCQPSPLHQLFPEAAKNAAIGSEAFSVEGLEDHQNLEQLIVSLQNKPQEENKQAQEARLIARIEQLAAEDTSESVLAQTLYGPGWKLKVSRYERLTERQEFVTIASIGLGFLGIVMMTPLIICALAWRIRAIVRASVRSMRKKVELENTVVVSDEAFERQSGSTSTALPVTDSSKDAQMNTGLGAWHQPLDEVPVPGSGSLSYRRDDFHDPRLGCPEDSEEAGVFDLFLTDQDSVQTRHMSDYIDSSSPQKTAEIASEPKMLASLETRAEDVARQITHAQELVTDKETQAPPTTEPFNETLRQLNDQISSIRQYASSQQDRVEKLQTGYDWNIIRTFCLRIIRCIDNLDDRIEQLPDDSVAIEMLCDIRDELLFSLESSGVERFDLEHGSEFLGQERRAEAIKEKEVSDNPALKGRIARVVKFGYLYIIDDENEKVVRTARVKLYG